MSIEMPGEVQWLLPIVVGQSWPEGDEDAMRRMADAWRAAADGIEEVRSTANSGATQANGAMDGKTADAFEKMWKEISEGGDAALPKLKEACEKLAKSCDDAALDVEHTKLTIIAALIALAIQLAAMAAAAPFTLGASGAGAAAAQVATRSAVQIFFRQLVMSILKNVAIEVATSVAIEFSVQGVQVAQGNRDGFDAGKVGEAAVSGAIGGVVGGVFEGVGKGIGRGAGDAVGDAAGDAAGDAGSAAGRAAGDAAGDAAGEAAESAAKSVGKEALKEGALGAAEGATASVAEQAITKGEVDWGDVGMSTTSGGVTGAGMGAAGAGLDRAFGGADVPDTDGGTSGSDGGSGSSSDSGGSSGSDGRSGSSSDSGGSSGSDSGSSSSSDSSGSTGSDGSGSTGSDSGSGSSSSGSDGGSSGSGPGGSSEESGSTGADGSSSTAGDSASGAGSGGSGSDSGTTSGTSDVSTASSSGDSVGGSDSSGSSPDSGAGSSSDGATRISGDIAPDTSSTPASDAPPTADAGTGTSAPQAGSDGSDGTGSDGGTSGGSGGSAAAAAPSGGSHSGGSGSFSGSLPTDRTPDTPAATSSASESGTATAPPPAGPAGPSAATPGSTNAPSGPAGVGGVAGAPPAGGGATGGGATPSTGRAGSSGWTGTAGSPGAAQRPTGDTGSRPDSGRPSAAARGPEAPARSNGRPDLPQQRTAQGTEAPTTRPDGARPDGNRRPGSAEDPRPDRPESTEAPPHGGTDGDEAQPDHPTDGDAEPSTPERQDQIDAAESTRQQTPSGSSFHTDPNMRDLADRVPDDGVHHTADVHALPDGRVRIGNSTFSAKEFADMLRNDPNWDGKPVRLLSCDAGTSGLARDLADDLGVPVTAPRGLAWTDSTGRVFASDMSPDGRPGWPPNGGWDTHNPDGTKTEASNDGFHHPESHERYSGYTAKQFDLEPDRSLQDAEESHTPDDQDPPADAEARGERPTGWDVSDREEAGAQDPYHEPYIPKDPQHGFQLEDIAEDRVTRDDDGLIETVDDKPVGEYTRNAIEDRQRSMSQAIEENRGVKNPRKAPFAAVGDDRAPHSYKSLGGKPGAVNAVIVDRRYGLVFEGINGATGNVLPTSTTTADGRPATGLDDRGTKFDLTDDDLMHPALREHISSMAERPGRPLNEIEQGEFPHRDLPHRHGEVKALDGILKQREELAAAHARATGQNVESIETVTRSGHDVEIVRIKPGELQSVVDDLSVDARFSFKPDPMDVAPCCANCARIVSGPASLPTDVRAAADLSHGAQMGTGGFTAGVHTDANDLNPKVENPDRAHTDVANSHYHAKFDEQRAKRELAQNQAGKPEGSR